MEDGAKVSFVEECGRKEMVVEAAKEKARPR